MAEPELRRLRPDEFEASLGLSRFAFQWEPTPEDVERQRRGFDRSTEWGVFEHGRLASKLQIHGFRTWVGGLEFPVGGVAGVASWPQHRRRGNVARLLRHSLGTMREAGQVLSFLYPFSFSFYRRFGWETAGRKLRHEIPRADLPRFAAPAGRWEPVTDDPRPLARVYDLHAPELNGAIARDETHWRERRVTGRRFALAYVEAGDPRAYVLYSLQERRMDLHEAVWLDEPARRAVWHLVAQHDSMVERVVWESPVDDTTALLLENPAGVRQELVPTFMARIVDLERFLRELPWENPGSFMLEVHDEHAPWNAGRYRVETDGNGTARSERTSAPAELSTDVGTLSALLLNAMPAEVLHRTGRLLGDAEGARRLGRMVPKRTVHLYDYF